MHHERSRRWLRRSRQRFLLPKEGHPRFTLGVTNHKYHPVTLVAGYRTDPVDPGAKRNQTFCKNKRPLLSGSDRSSAGRRPYVWESTLSGFTSLREDGRRPGGDGEDPPPVNV